MPLDASTMAAAIKTQVSSAFTIQDDSQLTNFCTALATAIVAQIQANAQVTVTGTVTSGAGSGGTVTGTGTIS